MKNNYFFNKKISFNDIFFSFPVYAGILFVVSNYAVLCQVQKQGNINLQTFPEKGIIKHNIPFLRGVEYLINCFVIYAKYFVLSLRNYFGEQNNKNAEKIKNKKKFFLLLSTILFITLGIIFCSWFLFWFLPAKIGFAIFPNNYNFFLKNLCVGTVKCLILWVVIFGLRVFVNIKNLLQLNTAGNLANCNGQKFNALNFFNVLISTLLLNFFVVSLIGLNASWGVEFVFQLVMFLVCASVAFEICLLEENTASILKKIRVITCVLFYASPSKTDKQIAFCGYTEGERMKENNGGENLKFVNITTSQTCYPIALVLSEVKNALKKANIEDFGEPEWLIACVLGCKKLDLKLIDKLDAKQYALVQEVLKRRVNNEPLAKIFGETEFYGLKFVVNKNVLTPRQDTEILVEEVLKNFSGKNNIEILDLCTGSGAIGIALAHNLKNAKVLAVDISEEALAVAEKNAGNNEIKNIKFKQSDLFSGVKKHKKFDVIVSNPPYIATDEIAKLDKEVKNFDPILALDGGVDGLYFYKRIALEAPRFLKQNGMLFLEIGFKQGLKVKKLLTQDFENIKIIKDYAGLPRVVVATKKDK